MNAARMPARSSARSPAAVVPPGDVTSAAELGRVLVRLGQQRGRADQELRR